MRKSNFIKTSIKAELKSMGVDFVSCVGEVGLHYNTKHQCEPTTNKRKITSSQSAVDVICNSYPPGSIEYREYFKVILLNRAAQVLAVVEISSGGVSGTVADPKLVFQAALLANASSLILAHNHPSGNTRPSHGDIDLTKKMKNCGLLLEITVLDHIIVTEDNNVFYSFADKGML